MNLAGMDSVFAFCHLVERMQNETSREDAAIHHSVARAPETGCQRQLRAASGLRVGLRGLRVCPIELSNLGIEGARG